MESGSLDSGRLWLLSIAARLADLSRNEAFGSFRDSVPMSASSSAVTTNRVLRVKVLKSWKSNYVFVELQDDVKNDWVLQAFPCSSYDRVSYSPRHPDTVQRALSNRFMQPGSC
jgi:hypothetical protein